MNTEGTLPTAIDSERSVLSSLLYDQSLFPKVRMLISDDEWYLPAHEQIWRAICELANFGAVDFVSVRAQLASLNAAPALTALTALTEATTPGSIEWHCERIVLTKATRDLIAEAARLNQRAEEGAEPVALAEDTITALRLIQRANEVDAGTTHDFSEIVERQFDPTEFVVPGLLARRNRIIITAPEGYGKSSLLRQIAACAAGGMHPFKTLGSTRPARVLVIDAENPADINTAEYRQIAEALTEMGHFPTRGMLTIDECGDIDLLDPRTAARFYGLIERVRPELIVIGPVYKLHEEDPNLEGPARKLSAVLNRMIAISDAALVLEAHTPHNDGPAGQLLRPFGASLWKRWPDFGYCLHPATVVKRGHEPTYEEQASLDMRESKFTSWRGSRAVRAWPGRLCKRGDGLPWGMY